MGGSFSARVAKVLSGIVRHILEDEVDGQRKRQGDQREDGEEGEVNGVVEEKSDRHTTMRMKHEMG